MLTIYKIYLTHKNVITFELSLFMCLFGTLSQMLRRACAKAQFHQNPFCFVCIKYK